MADPALAAQLGTQARTRAARYTVGAMTAGVLDLYRLFRPELFAAARQEAAA
jgi:glycogen(starch) synthase